jgi:hypothetical protein
MFTVVSEHAFPFLRKIGGDDSTYAHHMKGARFTIPTAALLAKVVDLIDQVPMEDRDTKGDLYEYMLGKIASAGQNGQFRTPRHIIRLMVEMIAPWTEGRHLRSRVRHRWLRGTLRSGRRGGSGGSSRSCASGRSGGSGRSGRSSGLGRKDRTGGMVRMERRYCDDDAGLRGYSKALFRAINVNLLLKSLF